MCCDQNFTHSRSSFALLQSSNNIHSRGMLIAIRSATLITQQSRSVTTLRLFMCSFCVNREWRDTVHTTQEPSKLQGIMLVLPRFWPRSLGEMISTRIVSARILSRHTNKVTWSATDQSHEVLLTSPLLSQDRKSVSQRGHFLLQCWTRRTQRSGPRRFLCWP